MQQYRPFLDTNKLKNACDILGVSMDTSLNEIREKFKKLVLIHHPDRGGLINNFNKIKNAYNCIYIVKKNEEQQTRRENMKMSDYLAERNKQTTLFQHNNGSINHTNPSIITNEHLFNEQFEKNKQFDAYDEGREYFLKQEKIPEKMQIAIINEPMGFNGSFIENVRNCNGDEVVADYSTYVNKCKNKRDACCYDIQHAYANQPILENNMPNCRQDTYLTSANISKFKNERNSLDIAKNTQKGTQQSCSAATCTQKLLNDMEQQEKSEINQKRQYSLQKQREIMERQFLRI